MKHVSRHIKFFSIGILIFIQLPIYGMGDGFTVADVIKARQYKESFESHQDTECEGLNTLNQHGETPFSLILNRPKTKSDFVEWLLTKKADVTREYPSGLPICYPLRIFNPHLVEKFLECGARITGHTRPLVRALNRLRNVIEEENISESEEENVIARCESCIDLMIKAGCLAQDSQNCSLIFTSLGRAMNFGFPTITRLFLRSGANIFIRHGGSQIKYQNRSVLAFALELKKEYTRRYSAGIPTSEVAPNLYEHWKRHYRQKQCARVVLKWEKRLLKLEEMREFHSQIRKALVHNNQPRNYLACLPNELMELLLGYMKENLGMFPLHAKPKDKPS